MARHMNHIHIKAEDPRAVADFLVAAFDFAIVSDDRRPLGDRLIRCRPPDDSLAVLVSDRRQGEILGPAPAGAHFGLDHLAFDSEDIGADIEAMRRLGAELLEGPFDVPDGVRAAFLLIPGEVRIELVERRPPS